MTQRSQEMTDMNIIRCAITCRCEISCEKECCGGAPFPTPRTREPFLSIAGILRSSFIPARRGAGTLFGSEFGRRPCLNEVGARWVTLVGKLIEGNIRIGGPSRIGLGWGTVDKTVWSAAGVWGLLRGRWIRGFFVWAFFNTGFDVK